MVTRLNRSAPRQSVSVTMSCEDASDWIRPRKRTRNSGTVREWRAVWLEALDDRQKVLGAVRHLAKKRLQRVLAPLLRGDLERRADDADHLARLVAVDVEADVEPAHGVAGQDRKFEAGMRAGAQDLLL